MCATPKGALYSVGSTSSATTFHKSRVKGGRNFFWADGTETIMTLHRFVPVHGKSISGGPLSHGVMGPRRHESAKDSDTKGYAASSLKVEQHQEGKRICSYAP